MLPQTPYIAPDPSGASPQPPMQPQPVLPSAPPTSIRPKHEGLKSIITTVLILLIAPILALAITAYVFQSYEVDGPSMKPTLQHRDRLIIWKAGRTWAKITRGEYVPERASVIVFVKKGLYDFSSNKEKQLIKRVIGLPGDHVVVKDNAITIYNDENPDGFNPDKTLEYGASITKLTEGNVDLTVGPGEIFVAGDNRTNSLDSRYFGTVAVGDIIGTLSVRILPISEAEKF
ncbi:signal peptidase I [Candidatus Saccharibacteria bacterium]|nr:signal peptidase I [Candidatus Saccharibacteria bacterium]